MGGVGHGGTLNYDDEGGGMGGQGMGYGMAYIQTDHLQKTGRQFMVWVKFEAKTCLGHLKNFDFSWPRRCTVSSDACENHGAQR